MATEHTIDEALDRFELIGGPGSETEGKACVMTALSWVAGEAWSDHPPCAHRILASIAIRANDHDSTTPEQRAEIVRAGEHGIIDTWWVPGEVIAAAQIVPGEGPDTRSRVQRCLDVLGAIAWWKVDKHRPNLTGANLAGANLTGANLTGAYLRYADLRCANLRGAYLGDASLRGANLRGADLSGAYLRGAYLGGADLACANLACADLACANLACANLGGAYANEWTVLPDGCGWAVENGRIVKAGA